MALLWSGQSLKAVRMWASVLPQWPQGHGVAHLVATSLSDCRPLV